MNKLSKLLQNKYNVIIAVLIIVNIGLAGLLIQALPSQNTDNFYTQNTLQSRYISEYQQNQSDLTTSVYQEDGLQPIKTEEDALTDETRKVVKFDKELNDQEKQDVEAKYGVKLEEGSSDKGIYTVKASAESKVEEIEKVAQVETDARVTLLAEEVDWGVQRIGSETAWEYSYDGTGSTIAIIDTGVDMDHQDLQQRITGGYDFVNEDANPDDDNGHGTHVAGITAATSNSVGTVGVSHQTQIMPIKVLDDAGNGYVSDVAKGIYRAVDNGADIINLSLGTTADSSVLKDAVDYAYENDVMVVGAAGNNSGDPCMYPGAYDSAICVVATDKDNKLASFSNVEGEFAAPGVSNYSTYNNGEYAYLSGTSMAAPHVAGSAAVVMDLCDCGAKEVRQLMRENAVDIGDEGKDIIFGYGLVDLVTLSEEQNQEESSDDTSSSSSESSSTASESSNDKEDEQEEKEEQDKKELPDEARENSRNKRPEEDERETGEDEEEDEDDKDEREPRAPESNVALNQKYELRIKHNGQFYSENDRQAPKRGDRRFVITDEEELDLSLSFQPAIVESDLRKVEAYVGNNEKEDLQVDDNEISLEDVELSNGQFVTRIKVTYQDRTVDNLVIMMELNLSEFADRPGRAFPGQPGNAHIKGIFERFDY